MKVVIIGFGEMGKRHGLDMEELSSGKIEVIGVCEPDKQKYEKSCNWLKHRPPLFNSIKELLYSTAPDGAIISSANYCHLENLREFAGMKIPLILEKPLDATAEKVYDVVRFVENYEAPVMVHHVMRYAPIIKKGKEIIDSGVLGKICSFRFCQTIGGHLFHNFRRNMETGGGQLLEKATHDFDVLLHWVGAAPRRVSAICKQQYHGGNHPNDLHCSECPEINTCRSSMQYLIPADNLKDIDPSNDLCVFSQNANVPDNEVCTVEFDNGVFGTYSQTFFVNGYFSRVYEIIGTEAVMRVCLSIPSAHKKTGNDFDGFIEIFGIDISERFEFNYDGRIHYNGAPGVVRHFYDLMTGEKKPYSPVDQAFAAEMIALAAYHSNSNSNAFVDIRSLLPSDLLPVFQQSFIEK
jgi:predicted dehydrogenase